MIKATGRVNGRETLFLGLSFANLEKFRREPGDTFIHIDGKEVGTGFDVLIFSGETEAHCTETLAGGIGPQTKVRVSPKSKQ